MPCRLWEGTQELVERLAWLVGTSTNTQVIEPFMEPGTQEKANSDLFPHPTSPRGWWAVLGPPSHVDHILKIPDFVHPSPFHKWGIIKKVIDCYTNVPNTQTPQTLYIYMYIYIWLYQGLVAAHGLFNAECRIFSYGMWTLSCRWGI